MEPLRRLTFPLAALLVLGCGETTQTSLAVAAPAAPLVVRAEVTATGGSAQLMTLASASPVTAMLAVDGRLYVGSDAGVSRVTRGVSQPVPVLAADGESTTTGRVRGLIARGTEVLVLGDEGLFQSTQGVLVPSPLTASLAGLTLRDLCLHGDALYLPADEGLVRVVAGQVSRLTFAGVTEAPTRCVSASADRLIVAFTSEIVELSPNGDTAVRGPSGAGTVRAVIAGLDGAVHLATTRGVLSRDAGGAWTLWPIAGGAGGLTVWEGGLAVATATSLLRYDAAGWTPVATLPASEGARPLAIASSGHPVVAAPSALVEVQSGTGPSFEASVSPVLAASCGGCHATGAAAPKHDFSQYAIAVSLADVIVQRVTTGVMPPATSPRLSAEALEALLNWYDGGMNP